mgnify:CR=1 FL=1
MNTIKRIEIIEKIANYLDMVKFAEQLIESHKETINNPSYMDFLNLNQHYYQRININRLCIIKMNNRINNLLTELLNTNK